MSNVVTQLPPTLGIKDPETRSFLDSLVNLMDLRSGNTNAASPEKFVTLGDLSRAINGDSSLYLGTGTGTVTVGSNGTGSTGNANGSMTVEEMIRNLEDKIKESLIFQILQTPINYINTDTFKSEIDAALQSAEAGIKSVSKSVQTATESWTLQLDTAISRAGVDSAAGIIEESQTRATNDLAIASEVLRMFATVDDNFAAYTEKVELTVTRDTALARAVNTLWAAVGGNEALIQDGELASVTPSAVEATKWTQLQAQVIDPNTGQNWTALLYEDYTAYANSVDGTLNSIYSLRTQTSRDGRTVVGGFGIATTNGAGSEAGPEVTFGVAANTFFIASPQSIYDETDEASKIKNDVPTEFPFIALSTRTLYDGVWYEPGVYIKSANIATASVDTLKIGGEAVTKTRHAQAFPRFTMSPSYSTYLAIISLTIPTAAGESRIAISGVASAYPVDNEGATYVLGIATSHHGAVIAEAGVTIEGGGVVNMVVAGATLPPGTHNIYLVAKTQPEFGAANKECQFFANLLVQAAFR